jgi:hypothetical protein
MVRCELRTHDTDPTHRESRFTKAATPGHRESPAAPRAEPVLLTDAFLTRRYDSPPPPRRQPRQAAADQAPGQRDQSPARH